jgi:hypothetical protein
VNGKESIAAALAQQRAQSAALPTIQTGKAAAIASGTREQRRIPLTVAAGATFPIAVSGDFFLVEQLRSSVGLIVTSSLTTPLLFTTDTANAPVQVYTAGDKHKLPTDYNILYVSNPSTVSVDLIIWLGFGDYVPGIINTGPRCISISGTMLVTIAGAYAAGDAVGGGTNSIPGAFLVGYNYARITRARLSKDTLDVANADFSLLLWNGDAVLTPATDHAAYVIASSNAASMQPPLRFPIWKAGTGLSSLSFCDLADFASPMVAGSGATGRNLFWQIIAEAPYIAVNPTNFRFDATLELF